MIKIPSFVFPNAAPTQQDLLDCRTVGLISPAVSAYASQADYDQPQNPLPPTEGRAKWWANPNVNKGIGTAVFSGNVITGGRLTLFMAMNFSQTVRNFYQEHTQLQVPELVYEAIEPTEWERVSFSDGPLVPLEYPLGEIFTMTSGLIETNYPGNMVLFMLGGRPCACGIQEGFRILRRS